MQNYKNKLILVTGGAGFIGSHLVEKLVGLGAKVTVLDNLSTGTSANLASVKSQITLVIDDICNPELRASLAHTSNNLSWDIIFHLAAATSVPESLISPAQYHAVNLTGTLNVLQLCHSLKTRLIFSSSSAVYGEKSSACSEQDHCQPSSIYGLNKLMGEQYCQIYSQLYQVPTLCLRYFNVYGPRQNPQGSYAAVYTKFSHNLAHNLPITIYGDGTQARDFVPVEQVVLANLRAGLLDYTQLNGQAVNIGSGQPTKINALLSQLQQHYPGNTSTVELAPARPGDVQLSYANISKAHQLGVL